MRKYQILVFGVILLLGVLAAGTLLRAAEIIYVEGSVQVQSPEDKVWKNAEKGMLVAIGDSIRTARHSKADIAVDPAKKNTIRLGEKTLIVLNSASEGNMDRVDLARGTLYSNMEGLKSGLSFEVNTPSAVAGVRGSGFRVYTERDSDEISAYKDTVFVKAFDADKHEISDIMLPEGFKTYIDRFEAPGSFIQISEREYQGFDDTREDLSSRAEGRERSRVESDHQQRQGERAREHRMREERSEEQQRIDQAVEEEKDINEGMNDIKEIIEERNTDTRIDELREEELPVQEHEPVVIEEPSEPYVISEPSYEEPSYSYS